METRGDGFEKIRRCGFIVVEEVVAWASFFSLTDHALSPSLSNFELISWFAEKEERKELEGRKVFADVSSFQELNLSVRFPFKASRTERLETKNGENPRETQKFEIRRA